MPRHPSRDGPSLRTWMVLSTSAALTVFAIDSVMPPTVQVAMLYAVVVLLNLRAPDPRAVLGVAILCSVLAWVDGLVTHRGSEDTAWLVNTALVVGMIWVATFLVHRYMVVARSWIERSVKELEDTNYALDQSAIVARTDTRGIIRYANDKFCEIAKYSREELIGRDHRIINSGYHPKAYIRELWQTISSGRIWKGELRNRAKDGTLYWVDTTIVPFLDGQGRPYQYVAIRYDITERKRSEALLREQAALARLGEMAAVVAHEVKNPLAGIRGALQVISARMPAESRDRAVIGDILARLDSLNEMVQDLLLFARPRAPRMAHVPIGALIEATAVLLKKDPHLAQVDVIVHGGEQTVEADAELLQIVFSNLLLNAAQAMSGHGTVTVSVERHDGRCDLTVHDTGPGMPPEVRERMFEPFFTTKHRGTGLGLSTAKRLVEQHRGEMRADCPPGGGTRIVVSLPAEKPDALPQAAAAQPGPPVEPSRSLNARMSFPRLTPEEAAGFITDGQTVGFSGFTPAGAAKLVPRALAARAREEHQAGRPFRIRVITGASTGQLDDDLADAEAISWRAPYQSSAALRAQINSGSVEFVDMHLSHVPQALLFGFFGEIDLAVVEATEVSPDGQVFLTTSVGLSPTLLHAAKKIVIEVNHRHSPRLREMMDIALLPPPPHRLPIPILDPLAKDRRPVCAGRPFQNHRRRRTLRARRCAPVCARRRGQRADRRPGRPVPSRRAARGTHPAGVPAAAGGCGQRGERGHGAARPAPGHPGFRDVHGGVPGLSGRADGKRTTARCKRNGPDTHRPPHPARIRQFRFLWTSRRPAPAGVEQQPRRDSPVRRHHDQHGARDRHLRSRELDARGRDEHDERHRRQRRFHTEQLSIRVHVPLRREGWTDQRHRADGVARGSQRALGAGRRHRTGPRGPARSRPCSPRPTHHRQLRAPGLPALSPSVPGARLRRAHQSRPGDVLRAAQKSARNGSYAPGHRRTDVFA